jgi:hypothetical protein
MSTLPPYIYEPLSEKDGVPAIRLVTIKPGPKGSKISCTLNAVSLQPFPAFEALSYVWGDPLVRKPIEIDEKDLMVTINLELALQYLRIETTTRVFWIDAICVDQTNLAERSEQVQLMARIYEGASQVILWLGDEDRDTKPAFDMARKLGASAILSRPDAMFRFGFDLNAMLLDILQGISLESFASCASLDLTSFTEEEMTAFKNTFERREWWTRLWVVQECVLATKAVMFCGRHSILLDNIHSIKFGKVLDDPAGSSWLQGRIKRILFKAAATGLLRAYRCAQKRVPWPENPIPDSADKKRLDVLLGTFSAWKCTDPRDIVYALLGLAYLAQTRIVPNYKQSLAALFTELTTVLIQETGTLNSFGLCTGVNKNSWLPSESVPSWVSDYRVPVGYSLLANLANADRQLYSASGAAPVNPQVLATASQGVLTLSGTFWDQIQYVSKVVSERDSLGPRLQAVIRDWQKIALTSNLYKTGETALDAFWRTLLRDFIGSNDVIDGTVVKEMRRIDMRYSSHYRDLYQKWVESNLVEDNSHSESLQRAAANKIQTWLEWYQPLIGYCFFISKRGYMGVILGPAQVGDSVCVVDGSCTPLILRKLVSTPEKVVPVSEEGFRTLVATAYVHGIMDGEVSEAVKRGEEKKTLISLV